MNRKQFVILLVVMAVLGAAGVLVYQKKNASWKGGGAAIGQKLLPNFPVNDVAQIIIKSGTNELVLARRDNLWRVQQRAGYPANFQQISELLVKIGDLKTVQSEEMGPSQLGRFELLPPGPAANTATSVEFKDQGGKSLGVLLLGKKHLKKPAANPQFGGMGDEGWPDGRYVMAGVDAKTVAVISDPLDVVQTKADQWLNKNFLNVEKPRSITVQSPEATNSWTMTRASETNDWQIAGPHPGEKLDSSKISSVTSPFSSPNFNDVSPGEVVSSPSNTVVKVETFDGFSYTAKIGHKLADDYPVSFMIVASLPDSRAAGKDEKPEDKAKLDQEFQTQQKALMEKLARESQFTNWTYLLPSYSIDEILKPRHELMEEAATNTAAKPDK